MNMLKDYWNFKGYISYFLDKICGIQTSKGNCLVTSNLRVIPLSELKNMPPGELLQFPTEFAKMNTAIYSDSGPKDKSTSFKTASGLEFKFE